MLKLQPLNYVTPLNGETRPKELNIHHFNFLRVPMPVCKEPFIFFHVEHIHMRKIYINNRGVFFKPFAFIGWMSKLLLELQDNAGRCKTYFIVISRPLTWCLCVSAGWFAARWLVLKEWPPLAEIIGPELKQQSTYSNWLFTNLPKERVVDDDLLPASNLKGSLH